MSISMKTPVKCEVIFSGHFRCLMKLTIHVMGKKTIIFLGSGSAGLTLCLVYIHHIQHKIQMCISSSLQIPTDYNNKWATSYAGDYANLLHTLFHLMLTRTSKEGTMYDSYVFNRRKHLDSERLNNLPKVHTPYLTPNLTYWPLAYTASGAVEIHLYNYMHVLSAL